MGRDRIFFFFLVAFQERYYKQNDSMELFSVVKVAFLLSVLMKYIVVTNIIIFAVFIIVLPSLISFVFIKRMRN